MSDLRTRIAVIVTQLANQPCCDSSIHAVEPSGWSLDVADAVIRELGLRQERQQGPYNFMYRYVTETMTDE